MKMNGNGRFRNVFTIPIFEMGYFAVSSKEYKRRWV